MKRVLKRTELPVPPSGSNLGMKYYWLNGRCSATPFIDLLHENSLNFNLKTFVIKRTTRGAKLCVKVHICFVTNFN